MGHIQKSSKVKCQTKQRILIRPIKNGIPDDLWQKIIHSEETKTKKRS